MFIFFFFFQDFQFHQMKMARVFEASEDLPKERASLLTVSNKYGLIFVGFDRTFKVFRTQDILDADKDEGNFHEVGTNCTVSFHHDFSGAFYLFYSAGMLNITLMSISLFPS